MRPARLLIALVLGLTAVSVVLIVSVHDSARPLAILWGVLVVVALGDLLTSVGRRNIAIRIDAPANGFNGMSVPFAAHIAARRGVLPRRIEPRLTLDKGLEATWDAPAVLPPKTREVTLETPIQLTERGEKAISNLALKYASRLGLFDIILNWRLERTITVLPNINPILSGDIHTRMLPLMDGMKDMNLRGEGSELHQLREFVPGMDPRSIDWKRSARMRSLTSRETRAERNHQIILCVDSGHLMGERVGKLLKLDHAINAALALTWAGGLGGDSVGFYSFSSQPQHFIPPRPGRAAFGRVQVTCADLHYDAAETNHTLGLSHLNGKLSRRSLVVIFSDFVDSVTAELLIENLAVMTRQHLVLYVAMRDPALQDTARPGELSMDAISRSVSAAQVLQERQAVLDRLQRLGVLCLDTDPGSLTSALISRYIDIKAQELI